MIPGPRRSLGGENGNPLQYFARTMPWRVVWWGTVHRIIESDVTEPLSTLSLIDVIDVNGPSNTAVPKSLRGSSAIGQDK